MLDEKTHEKLTALAQSSKLKNTFIVKHLVGLAVEYGLLKPGWIKRFNEGLEKADRDIDREDIPDDACPALQRINDIIWCIWAQKNAPPKTKKLSPELREALKACVGCARTREILDGIASYEETIRNLKAEAKRGIVVQVPRCVHDPPGVLESDGLSFWCRMSGQKRTVKKCKTLRNGQPCRYLEWMKVPVKGELAEPER